MSAVTSPTAPQPRTVLGDLHGDTDRAVLGCFAVWAAALFLIPARYTVPLSSQLGLRPHQLVVVVIVVLIGYRFVRGRAYAAGLPALAAGFLLLTSVASIAVNGPGLSEQTFLNAFRLTVTTLLSVLAAIMVAFVATTAGRRRFIAAVAVTMVAASAVFAIHESVTAEPLRYDPVPPGLVEEVDPGEDDSPSTVIRNGVNRPAGTTASPLELSAVMALALPFAVYLVFSAGSLPARLWFLACVVLTSIGLVLAISRTGVLSAATIAAVALVLNLGRPKLVLLGLGAAAALCTAVVILVPESVDATLLQLGKSGDEDPSLATRLQDYQELDNLLGPSPWFGRGPEALTTYVARDGGGLILDNQYLLLVAENGVVGLAALVLVLVCTAGAAVRRARSPSNERGLWIAAACAVTAFGMMCATFDILRFSQPTSLFMLIVGLTAAAQLPLRHSLVAAQPKPIPARTAHA